MNNLPMLFAVLIACVLGSLLVRRVISARLKPVRTRSHLAFDERTLPPPPSDRPFRLERLKRLDQSPSNESGDQRPY